MTELAREYGDGLYALCAEEKLDARALEELAALKGVFRQEKDFFRLLSNMSLSKEERVGILDHTLRGQVHPYLLNFLKILCERGALGEFEGCESAFRENYNRDHGVLEAQATTGAPLDDAQRKRLTEKLHAMTNREIYLSEKVDPSVIGGVLLEMDGKRYDSTLRGRLMQIRAKMTGDER